MGGPLNWLSQTASVTKFGLLTIPQRKGTVAATIFGIAGVVTVLVGVLSIGQGFRRAMTVSGAPDTALVLRAGADSEMVSGLSRADKVQDVVHLVLALEDCQKAFSLRNHRFCDLSYALHPIGIQTFHHHFNRMR